VMKSIAAKIGCSLETLRRWCREEVSRRSGPAARAADDRERLRLLEREVKELRRANEILRKTSAYFGPVGPKRQTCRNGRNRRRLDHEQIPSLTIIQTLCTHPIRV